MTKAQLFMAMWGVGLLGMISHFLKLKIKGQTPQEIFGYFIDNFKDTLTATIGMSIGVFGAWTAMDPTAWTIGVIAAFPIGYTFDSVFTSAKRK